MEIPLVVTRIQDSKIVEEVHSPEVIQNKLN